MGRKAIVRPAGDKGASTPSDRMSTMGVDRNIADQIRALAKEHGATTLDLTNELLKFALANAEITVPTKQLTVDMKDRACYATNS
jgi:hypothetical protein